ncbi:uncharacterized protein [Diabrotica undecimpunctata]|uniref:uncharacterized protein n=1 Tax=Diabrotica undecimpunctata TaxID=50387 RepID=UPI003B639EE8
MYYISKFCRICVQTDVKLLDINTVDFDKIKLSEKLEACTKMVVSGESLSREICLQCLSKLRTSYEFLNMCKKSTKKLHSYYRTLVSKQNDENLKNFINTDLHVFVTPISDSCYKLNDVIEDSESTYTREKRKRITKEQRCSLLKRLLSNPEPNKREWSKKYLDYSKTPPGPIIGGLKSIINFTNNYEFGISLDKNSNYESTPLEKLTAFSTDFFRKDFTEFKNTVLYIIENKDNLCDSGDSEDDEYFMPPKEDLQLFSDVFNDSEDNSYPNCTSEYTEDDSKESIVKFEEVIVEPDIKIKTELEYEDGECLMNETMESVKQEVTDESESNDFSSTHHDPSSANSFESDYRISSLLTMEKVSSMVSLKNFVGNYQHKRTFSHSNVRCRTRENPYINPLLRQQFLYRSFKCEKCNRYFKSPGYLKAHYSKVH